jgi:hypothetical protein
MHCSAVCHQVDKLETHLQNVHGIEINEHSRGPHFELA